MKVAIISPAHIQPSEQWISALDSSGADIIIVDDSNGKLAFPASWDVYGYDRQKEELGDNYESFIQFHKSSACKNFGLWLAWRKGYEYVIVLDSDCIIPEGFVDAHLKIIAQPMDGWINPVAGTNWYSRGFPYSQRNLQSWCNMGLWTNELDICGKDRFDKLPEKPPAEPVIKGTVNASESFFPLSGMNLILRRDAIPYLMFLPNFSFEDNHFTRHDDILGGYIFQSVSRILNKQLTFGQPWVYHDTLINEKEDMDDEAPMTKFEDQFYADIDSYMKLVTFRNKELKPNTFWAMLASYTDSKPLLKPLQSAFLLQSKLYE